MRSRLVGGVTLLLAALVVLVASSHVAAPNPPATPDVQGPAVASKEVLTPLRDAQDESTVALDGDELTADEIEDVERMGAAEAAGERILGSRMAALAARAEGPSRGSDDAAPAEAGTPAAGATSAAPAPAPSEAARPSPTAPPTAPAPAPPVPGVAGAFYVAPGGDDGGPGTAERPFRTIGRGLQAMKPGTTLFIRGGTYAETLKNPSVSQGTAAAPIVVAAYPGERPVLQGLLWLKDPSFWTIDGLNVTWGGASSGDHMVKLTGGVGWTLRNAELWGARSFAALFVGGEPSDWRVVGNCIHDTIAANGTNQDHNIYVNSGLGAGPGLIERNLLFNAPNGRNIKLGGSDTSSSEGSANVTIRSNTLYGASQSISLSGGTRNITIEWNLMSRASSGSLIRAYELTGSGNVVRNNLGHGADELLRRDGSSGLVDGGGNVFPRDPRFGSVACGGLAPADGTAAGYGRWR